MNRPSSVPIGPRRATLPMARVMARVVLLVVAIAALGFTIVTMHAMHLGPGHAPSMQTMATPHPAMDTTTAETPPRHAPGKGSDADGAATSVQVVPQVQSMADQPSDSTAPCASDCLVGGSGAGHGVAILCLSLLPFAALFALRLPRRLPPSTRGLETSRRVIGFVLGYRGPPRPRPTLAALCILRT
ncbi:hypothetical protein [Segeticoccus rhizosphaerae]|uniref:hypothetical protein n=1 Tax=Segeticoccus rhizosphaerae TaxID=1104777 RepID=UPI0010C0DA6D|nr:hypothetical protein [Ornithinicoccus soli]